MRFYYVFVNIQYNIQEIQFLYVRHFIMCIFICACLNFIDSFWVIFISEKSQLCKLQLLNSLSFS